jgi:hypothetical protein
MNDMEIPNTKNIYSSTNSVSHIRGFPVKLNSESDDYFIPWLREDLSWENNFKNLNDCCSARQLKFLLGDECYEEIDAQLSIPTDHPDSEKIRISGISACQKLQRYWTNWFAPVNDRSTQGTIRLWNKWKSSINSLSDHLKNDSSKKNCDDIVHPLFIESGMVPYLPIDGDPICNYTWRVAICGGDGKTDLHHPYDIPFTDSWWMIYINAKVSGKKIPTINPVWFNRMGQEYTRGFRISCAAKVLTNLSIDWPGVSFGAVPAGVITFNSSSPCTGIGDLPLRKTDVKRWKMDLSDYKTPYIFSESQNANSNECITSIVPIRFSFKSKCFCKNKIHNINDMTIGEYTLSENCL